MSSRAFEEALSRFKRGLKPEEQQNFSQTSIDDVYQETKRIQEEQGQKGRLRNLRRIQPYINGLVQYAKVIEVFVQAKPEIMAFIWGPTKFLLQITSNYIDSFDKLLDALKKIGESLPRFQIFAGIFQGDSRIQDVLSLVYEDILCFHHSILKFFRTKGWKQIFKSIWHTFEDSFGPILLNLERHKLLVDSEATAANILEAREFRVAALRADEDRKKDRERQQLRDIKEWLNPVSYEDYLTELGRRFCPNTGTWLIQEDDVKAWLNINDKVKRLLWLTGIPGSGKTMLSYVMLKHAELARGSVSVVYIFFKNDSSKNSAVFVTMMRTLIFRLLQQNSHLLPYIYDMFETKNNSLTLQDDLKGILGVILGNVGIVYLIIDGLDEVELEERTIMLSALLSLLSKADDLKIFFSSRSETDILGALTKFGDIYRVDIGVKNGSDIATYVSMAGEKVLSKFNVDASTGTEIREILRRVANGARGMFLWARLVIYNLLQQVDIEGLEDAAQNLPTGLEEAYGRILYRINEKLSENERHLAKRVLEWVLCCARPLRLKEIEQAIAIRIEDQCTNKRRRLLRRLDELCGPILEIGEEEKVHFVHFTAKEYLTSAYSGPFISFASAHRDVASICISYLLFTCFDSDLSDEKVIENINSEEYCLHEYAECNWLHHVRHAANGTDNPLDNLISLLDRFIERRRDPGVSHTLLHIPPEERFTTILDFWPKIHEHLVDFHVYNSGTFDPKNIERRNPSRLQSSIQNVRKNLENLFTSLSTSNDNSQLQFLQQTYGANLFKCPQFNCAHYLEGFETRKKRDEHLKIHLRPFKCPVKICDHSSMGFASAKALKSHLCRFHSTSDRKADDLDFKKTHFSEGLAKSPDLSLILFDAIASGDPAIVESALKHGPGNINLANRNGETPLHYALTFDSEEIIDLLLENGAAPNQKNQRDGSTALHSAITQGSETLVQLLLDWSADIEAVNQNGHTALDLAMSQESEIYSLLLLRRMIEVGSKGGIDALISAVKKDWTESAQLLLENGADINSQTFSGWTVLMEAVNQDNEPMAQLLLVKKADVNAATPIGNTALMIATGKGNESMVQSLLAAGADVNAATPTGNTALMIAVKTANKPIVQALLAAGADANAAIYNRETVLMIAIKTANKPIVQALLAAGADVNAATPTGNTVLMIAAEEGNESFFQVLLAAGADVNAATPTGNTALMIAVKTANKPIVQSLLAAGADVNAATPTGNTALMIAAGKGNESMVQLLMAAGADVNAAKSYGDTALTIAARTGNEWIVQLLLAAGADVNAVTDGNWLTDIITWSTALMTAVENENRSIVQSLLAAGADVNAATPTGMTALMIAAGKGNESMVQSLLAAGADANATINAGHTVLMMAAERRNESIIQSLLAAGADVNAATSTGNTALMIAAEKGNESIVQSLLAAGVDVNAAMSTGQTALSIALRTKNESIIQSLLAAGADIPTGKSLLAIAVEDGHESMVKSLLAAGADVKTVTVLGAIFQAGFISITHQLLAAGANLVRAKSLRRRPILIEAIMSGSQELVSLLLQNGAAIDVKYRGSSALRTAARDGSVGIVRILLEHGASVGSNGSQERIALMKAANIPGRPAEVLQMLLERIAEVDGKDVSESGLQI